jgi:hypothetical protein
VNGSEFLFEWDLQNIDLSQAEISSLEFSFKAASFIFYFRIKHDNYGCFLRSGEISRKYGGIHFRFDLVKRMD